MSDKPTGEVRPREILSLALMPERNDTGRSILTLLASVALQGTAIALLIIIPLMATDNLPTPGGMSSLLVLPPPPSPPPPAAPRVRTSSSPPTVRTFDTVVPTFTAPIEIPDTIALDDGRGGFDEVGVPGGVPGGITEGIVGLPSSPAPPEKEPAPVRVGGEIRQPRRTHHVIPDYPEIARQARVTGIVILEAVIDATGRVVNVRVLRSVPMLDQAAINAVRKWRYEPTRLNGVPVPIVMTVTVQFVSGARGGGCLE